MVRLGVKGRPGSEPRSPESGGNHPGAWSTETDDATGKLTHFGREELTKFIHVLGIPSNRLSICVHLILILERSTLG